jgi:hypothetical protein
MAEGVEIPSGDKVSLVSIEGGSEKLVLTMDPPYLAATVAVTRAVSRGGVEDLPAETLRELRSLSCSVANHGWALEFEADERVGIEAARLEPETIPAARLPPRLQGTTTVHARCLRVGGVEPKAELRLSTSGALLYASLSEEDAKALARRLYEEVVLEGRATWDAETWEIEDFRILGVSPYQTTDPVLAFKELAESARGRWDDVDAVEYVRKLREES